MQSDNATEPIPAPAPRRAAVADAAPQEQRDIAGAHGGMGDDGEVHREEAVGGHREEGAVGPSRSTRIDSQRLRTVQINYQSSKIKDQRSKIKAS